MLAVFASRFRFAADEVTEPASRPLRSANATVPACVLSWGFDNAALHLHSLSMEIDKSVSETGEASPIEFRLDPSSGVPTYLQIVQQVERALRLGYLVVGDRLPKVKEVVAALAINPNTVLKAYRDLEHKGLAAGRPGQGTFIEATLDVAPLPDQQALQGGLSRWLHEATEAGLDEEGIAALFASALHDLRQKGRGSIAS